MIDNHILTQLQEILSSHGEVQSISHLATGHPDQNKCMVLATMRSAESARKLNQQFGFATFGFNSIIIPDKWLLTHLPARQVPPEGSVE